MNNFKDSAEGQLAGYLFQPDRALFHLSGLSSRKHSVSIEFTDDVSVLDEMHSVILTEQDKHSIAQSNCVYSNGSKDLWRTLEIWLEKIELGILDPLRHDFICCTNKQIPKNYLIIKINNCNDDDDEARSIFDKLKAIQIKKKNDIEKSEKKIKTSSVLSKIMDNVISKEKDLISLIKAIKLKDDVNLDKLNDDILNNVNIPADHPHKLNILLQLKGWISERCKLLINSRTPVILSKEDLNNFLIECLDKYKLSNIAFTAKSQIREAISEGDILGLMSNTFVEQLNMIQHRNIKKIILDAIIDFLCYQKEILRIATLSNITAKDFEDFEAINKKRWENVFDRYITKELTDYTAEELNSFAYKIYDEVLSINVKFKDLYKIPISSDYFKNGNYHTLAEKLEIGWHPDWEKKLKVYDETA